MHRRHTTGSIDETEDAPDVVPTTSSGKKKRFRKAYSCANCRHRKIKCERTFPCHQCELRGIASSCGATTLYHEYFEADERKKQGLQISTNRPTQSHSQSQPSLSTFVDSPIDTISSGSSKAYSPAQATLETLNRTVNSFRTHIALVEQQVRSLQLSSSSSSSSYAATRESGQKHPHSSIPRDRSRMTDGSVDPIVEQLKELERKVDLIYQHVAMVCPSTSDLVTVPFAHTLSAPPQPPIPSEPPEWVADISSSQNDTHEPMDEMQLDPIISQWLQQENITANLDDQYGMIDNPDDSFRQAFLSLDNQEASGRAHPPPQ